MRKNSLSRSVFIVLNYFFVGISALLCLLPFLHVAAISLSSEAAATAGRVGIVPIEIHTFAYEWMLSKRDLWRSMWISLQRVVLGGGINLLLVVMTAYPLSKESNKFKSRTVYVWYFFFTSLFSGGMIPLFLTVKYTGIMDSIWALILPGALPVGYMILMLNFFRSVPVELEEAALIDGAGYMRSLFLIYIPVSGPAIATIVLFTALGQWNSWFDGLIYMNSTANYPFQTYLRSLTTSTSLQGFGSKRAIEEWLKLSERNVKAAQIIIGTVPILVIYPLLQKYFAKGIIIGSVKG